MQTFDIIFGIFALVLVILGIKRGFIEEIMRLIALVAGFIGALVFYRQFIPKIAFLKLPPEFAAVASFLIIFFASVLAIVLLGKLIKKVIRMTMLGWADRMGGACFGFLKAFIIGWIFVIAVSSLPFPGFANTLKKSKAFSFFAVISPVLKAQALRHGKLPIRKTPGHDTLPGIGEILNQLKKMGGKNDSAHNKKAVPSTDISTKGDSI
jgi:membrane protein required for colicin V production